jgi:hypothetical protein
MTTSTPETDRDAVQQRISALRDKGYVLRSVFDGTNMIPVGSPADAFAAITAVDQALLFVTLHGVPRGWVRFVLRNSPTGVDVLRAYSAYLSRMSDEAASTPETGRDTVQQVCHCTQVPGRYQPDTDVCPRCGHLARFHRAHDCNFPVTVERQTTPENVYTHPFAPECETPPRPPLFTY